MALSEEDAFDWAAFVLQVKSDNKDLSEEALIALKKPLERLAAAIAGRDSWLVQDAWSIVWAAIRSSEKNNRDLTFASVRNARAWCATVLRNRFRRENRSPRRAFGTKSHPDQGPLGLDQVAERRLGGLTVDDLIAKLDLTTPFAEGDEDLRAIADWPPKRRIRMLCMSGLWEKIPPGLWREWTIEAGLGPAFPPDLLRQRLLQCESRHDRTRALEAAGVAEGNTLQQMWGVGEPKLWELRFIKELLPVQVETLRQESQR